MTHPCLLLLVRGDIDQHPAAGPAAQLPTLPPLNTIAEPE
jgi:hypothetical protein